MQIVFWLVLTLPCPFSVVQFSRPHFDRVLRKAWVSSPRPPSRDCTQRVLRPSSSQRILCSTLRPAGIIIAAHAFPKPSFGPSSQLLQVSFARILFAIGGSFSLDHQLFCKALPGITYMAGRFVSGITKICVLCLKESLLSDMWHHALGSMVVTASTFKKFLSDGTCCT